MTDRIGGDIGSLVAAVAQVMKQVQYIQETGKNKFHGYNYASDEDLLKSLQPAMAEAGLSLTPMRMAHTVTEHTPDNKGKAQWRTDLTATYLLAHTGGGWMTVETIGCGVDGEDKGAYKAMTGALKYALRCTFLVPTGQDAERDRDDRRDPPQGSAGRVPSSSGTQAGNGRHDPSWEADRPRFCAKLKDYDMSYDEVADLLAFVRRPRPSAMTQQQRDGVLNWLGSTAGADKYREFLASKEEA